MIEKTKSMLESHPVLSAVPACSGLEPGGSGKPVQNARLCPPKGLVSATLPEATIALKTTSERTERQLWPRGGDITQHRG